MTGGASGAIKRWGWATLSGAVAVVLLLVAFPRLTGTTWTAAAGHLASLSASQLAILTVVWLGGLFVHTYVMIVPLPTLGHRRAMMLNFSGSAVANVLPFGGVAGMGVNYSMLRSWGYSRSEFSLMTLLTTMWSIFARLLLPSLAFCMLVAAGQGTSPQLAVGALVGFLAVGTIGFLATRWRPGTTATSPKTSMSKRVLDVMITRTTRDSMGELRTDAYATIHRRWKQLTVGTIAYSLLQALLLGLCLNALGTPLSPIDVFAGFATGSLLTLLPITPGGVGLYESGMAAVLIALGGDPATTTAAVLLFRTFTYVLEIPVGAVCTAAWWFRRPGGGASVVTRPILGRLAPATVGATHNRST